MILAQVQAQQGGLYITFSEFTAISGIIITLLVAIAGGIWRVSSIMTGFRNEFGLGRKTMNRLNHRANDHQRRLHALDGEEEAPYVDDDNSNP